MLITHQADQLTNPRGISRCLIESKLRNCRTWLYVLALGLTSQAATAQDPEQVFADALSYTVRIRTTLPTPFIEDTRGAFTGAGFVVDADRGWVLTNAHVVGRSPSSVRVSLFGEDFAPAEKLYVDPYVDVAVLQLSQDIGKHREARLLCDEPSSTGHPVGAFGHPWGLDYTGTQGVISGRTPKFGGDLLQTDAPINAGNSGGPLISLKHGEIVGISTASFADEEDQNTNFAVPIAHACKILTLLEAGEDPSPPQLPVVFFDRGDPYKPLIVARSFLDPSLLDLRSGDTILTMNGARVTNEGELVHALRGRLDDVQATVLRFGEEVLLRGRLDPAERVAARRGVLFSGILLAPGNMRDKTVLGLEHDIMVHSIEPGSEGSNADLYYFDYVIAVNGVRVRDLEHLYQTLSELPDSVPAELDFLRTGTTEEEGRILAMIRREIIATPPQRFGAWPTE